jgi:hypothetical protein
MLSRFRIVTAFLCLGLAAPACDRPANGAEDAGWDDLDDWGKADALGSDSYGALATVTVPPEFNAMVDGLASFDDQILPHEAKELRKQIGRVRDYVDLFVFAYPKGDDEDLWRELREDLDEGYETMGAFKDIFDVQGVEPEEAQYDEKEVAELRADVLEWKAKFTDLDSVGVYRQYVAAPDLEEIEDDRKKKYLPRFYWRDADTEPKEKYSGLGNMARLTRKLIEEAADDLDDTDELRDLHKVDNQEPFHDFRKRLRSVEKLAGYFPQIFEEDEDPTDLLALVELTVDRYGEINDHLVAYHRAKDHDDDDLADELKELIKHEWRDLRHWQDDEDVDDALDDLRSMIHEP